MSEEYLMAGSYGLDKDNWQPGFYDDALPPDWRAAYYSTLLRCVYLPPAEWYKAVSEDWVAEVDEDFRFILQAETDDHVSELTRIPADFRKLVAGVVVNAEVEKNRLQQLQKLYTVCLDAGAAEYSETGIKEKCSRFDVSCVWYPSTQSHPLDAGSLLIALFSNETLKEQREIVKKIEQWMAGSRRAGLFNTREKDAPERAQETRILIELMGV